jgi:hypothetical protein
MTMKMIENILYRIFVFCISVTFSFICFLSINKHTNSPAYIHPEFRGFISSFVKDAEHYKVPLDLSNLTVVFSLTGRSATGTVAFCLPGSKTIVVYPDYWQILSPSIKKALIYHEAGHCLLRRQHTEERLSSFAFCPISIMYPTIDMIELCYNQIESSYIEELFVNPYNYKTF